MGIRIATAVMLLLLVQGVHGIEVISHTITLDLSASPPAAEVRMLVYNDATEPLEKFRYPLPGSFRQVEVLVDGRSVDAVVEPSTSGEYTYVTITFPEAVKRGEKVLLEYSYTPAGITTRVESPRCGTTPCYMLSFTPKLMSATRAFNFSVVLPPGYGVVESSPPSSLGSDGRRMILRWELEAPIPPQLRNFGVIVIYEPLMGRGIPFSYILAALVVAAGAAGGAAVYLHRRRAPMEEKIEVLREDEQKIMKLIVENDGIDQREIVELTGFSKTKVSKILSELERRGIIRKEPVGRRNKIYLVKRT